MLIKRDVLERIKAGEIDLQFRRWKRPTVKSGGSLKTRVGVLSIGAVEVVGLDDLTDGEAERAGFRDAGELVTWLESTRPGEVYRIEVHYQGEDPRAALREQTDLDEAELAAIVAKLEQMDARSTIGPWTARAMELIAVHPGRLAETLAQEMDLEKHPFKSRIRKLKAMGLTESLEIGYRLSPRGERVHAFRCGTRRGRRRP